MESMPITRESILNAELGLIEGIKKSDVRYLSHILHDDLLFIAPNGQVVTKQMDLESHRKGDMVVESLTPTFEEIRILDTVATVIVVYETKGSMLGNPISGRFRYIRIWKDSGDGLKVIGGGCFAIH
ncbi:MAG TPA: nuclear transport factor 2 family protein [Fibrobacteria bacterium]|nr:nuclear transport factor 2 family protein [Fibrobacteria bacterium]